MKSLFFAFLSLFSTLCVGQAAFEVSDYWLAPSGCDPCTSDTLTLNASTNGALICVVWYATSQIIGTPTYAGQPLTQTGLRVGAANDNSTAVHGWYYADTAANFPDSGSVFVDFNGGTDFVVIAAIGMSNIDAANAVDPQVSDNLSANPAALSVPTEQDDIVVDCMYQWASDILGPDGDNTARIVYESPNQDKVLLSTADVSVSANMSWNFYRVPDARSQIGVNFNGIEEVVGPSGHPWFYIQQAK